MWFSYLFRCCIIALTAITLINYWLWCSSYSSFFIISELYNIPLITLFLLLGICWKLYKDLPLMLIISLPINTLWLCRCKCSCWIVAVKSYILWLMYCCIFNKDTNKSNANEISGLRVCITPWYNQWYRFNASHT